MFRSKKMFTPQVDDFGFVTDIFPHPQGHLVFHFSHFLSPVKSIKRQISK